MIIYISSKFKCTLSSPRNNFSFGLFIYLCYRNHFFFELTNKLSTNKLINKNKRIIQKRGGFALKEIFYHFIININKSCKKILLTYWELRIWDSLKSNICESNKSKNIIFVKTTNSCESNITFVKATNSCEINYL